MMQHQKPWACRLRALAAALALFAVGAAQAAQAAGVAVRAEGTLSSSGAKFGAVAVGTLWVSPASGGFFYSAPGREIQGVWTAFPLIYPMRENAPGGLFMSGFSGTMNGRPVAGWVLIFDRAPGATDSVALTVTDPNGGLLFRDQGTLPGAAVHLATGWEVLDVPNAIHAGLFGAFGDLASPGLPYVPFFNASLLQAPVSPFPGGASDLFPWERALENLRRALSGDTTPPFDAEEQEELNAAMATMATSLAEINGDGKVTTEDFASVRSLNEALATLRELLSSRFFRDQATREAYAVLTSVFIGLGQSIENGLQQNSQTGLSTIKELTSSQSGPALTLSVRLNDGEGTWQIDLYNTLLGLFGLRLEIHKDTMIEWTRVDRGGVLIVTPGTTSFDFDDFTLFGRHIAGPRLPEDLWITKVTLDGSAVTVEGSTDAEGQNLRRYEISGNGVKVYDGQNQLLNDWQILN
jgi:hypothetical protein